MNAINFKAEIPAEIEDAVILATDALKREGFGVLTRIDLHAKIQEKLGKEIEPTVILGACNPGLAYEAYRMNPDVASLLPCNAVIRRTGPGRVSVEFARPSSLMTLLDSPDLVALSRDADASLERALSRVARHPAA